MKITKITMLTLAVFLSSVIAVPSIALSSSSIAILPVVSASSSCTFTTTQSSTGYTYNVTFSGKDGSCPTEYADSSHLLHVILSTGGAQNPYSISITPTSCSGCPPSEVHVLGWAGDVVFCSGSCSASGPWTGTVNATVQAGKGCDTAPIMIKFGDKGQGAPVVILEAGVGGDCGSITPEFPLGTLVAVLAPVAALGAFFGSRKLGATLRAR
jgi:hypothetical protein